MNYIELVCKISAENPEEIKGILIAEMNEIDFESFDETADGIKAYIPEHLFNIENVKEFVENNSNCKLISY